MGVWGRILQFGLNAIVIQSSVAAQEIPAGYGMETSALAPPGAYVEGFDVLPNGNYAVLYTVFSDDFSDRDAFLQEVTPEGAVVRDIAEPGKIQGLFVRLDPQDPQTLYYGDRTNGQVVSVDLMTGATSQVLQNPYPVDFAVSPQGMKAFVWSPDFDYAYVAIVDVTGEWHNVLFIHRYSGEIAFNDDGDLYVVSPLPYRPRPNQTAELRLFRAEQIKCALLTDKQLAARDGELVGVAPDGSKFAKLDDKFFIVDRGNKHVVQTSPVPQESRPFFRGRPEDFPYQVRMSRGTRGVFESFQPEDSGTMHILNNNYGTLAEVIRVRPKRPHLAVAPSAAVPVGPFELTLENGLPGGVVGIWVASAESGSPVVFPNASGPAPLFWELRVDSPFLDVVWLPLDPQGNLQWDLVHDGEVSGSLAIQAMILNASGSERLGTSNPLTLEFQAP